MMFLQIFEKLFSKSHVNLTSIYVCWSFNTIGGTLYREWSKSVTLKNKGSYVSYITWSVVHFDNIVWHCQLILLKWFTAHCVFDYRSKMKYCLHEYLLAISILQFARLCCFIRISTFLRALNREVHFQLHCITTANIFLYNFVRIARIFCNGC